MGGLMQGFRDLRVYNAAFELAADIHDLSKTFPADESYGLTNQIRRSSRAVAAIIAEAYRKKRYPKSFVAKLIEADGENTETQVWLDFCRRFDYLTETKQIEFVTRSEEIGRMIGAMLNHPEKFSGGTGTPASRQQTPASGQPGT